MKKILLLATIFATIQSCAMLDIFDSAGKTVETARYRSTGWSTRKEIEEKYKKYPGYVVTVDCRTTNMQEWCKVVDVRKK